MAKNNIKFSAFPVEAVGRWAGSLSIQWRCRNESDFCGRLGCWALNKKFSSGIWLMHNSPEAVPHSQNCIYEVCPTFLYFSLYWYERTHLSNPQYEITVTEDVQLLSNSVFVYVFVCTVLPFAPGFCHQIRIPLACCRAFCLKTCSIKSLKTSQSNVTHFAKISTSSHVKVYCILEVTQCNQMVFGRYLWGVSHSSVRIIKYVDNKFSSFYILWCL